MAEDPIKLFATRAERYPEPTEADAALGAARAALAAIPIVGGTITEVLSMVLAPAVARRKDQWFKELADGLDELAVKVDGFRIENLQHDEAFVSAVIEASRSAISTHQVAKREALRNAVLNVALSKTSDEEKHVAFMHLIEIFSITHLELLCLFANRAAFPSARCDELRGQWSLTNPMVLDLNGRGLLNDPRPYIARTREPEGSLTLQAWTLSRLGNQFLSFIALPDALK